MKVNCPRCNRVVGAENIALDTGWGKCGGCNEVFRLADVLPGYTAEAGAEQGVPERPFDAWAVAEQDDGKLFIHLPAQGMRAATWAMFGFATFWTGFIAFWTAGALGAFWGGNGLRLENACFAAFSTPFWLIGFGMFASVLWMARGTRTVCLDASRIVTELRCLLFRRRRRLDRSMVQCAREGVRSAKSNDVSQTYFPFSAEIIYAKGSFKLPCTSEAEQRWLIALINGFLKSVPYQPDGWADRMDERDEWTLRSDRSSSRR